MGKVVLKLDKKALDEMMKTQAAMAIVKEAATKALIEAGGSTADYDINEWNNRNTRAVVNIVPKNGETISAEYRGEGALSKMMARGTIH